MGVFPYVVEVIVFFACAGTFTLQTIENEYIYQAVSEWNNFTANQSVDYCSSNQSKSEKEEIVAHDASEWTMYLNVATYISSVVSSIVLTSLSDRIGRKPALAYILLGNVAAAAINVCVIIWKLQICLLVIGGFVRGAFGAYPALMNVASAHLSDNIKEEDRGKRYTVLEVCASLGGGITLIGTGYWINTDGFTPSSFFVLGCCLLSLVWVAFLPAENKIQLNSDAQRTPVNTTNTLVCQMRVVWRIYTSERSVCLQCAEGGSVRTCPHGGGVRKGRVWRLWFYVASFSLYMFALNGLNSFETMFFVSYPICFTPILVGAQVGFESSTTLVAPFLVMFYQSVLGLNKQTILLTGIFSRISTTTLMYFAQGAALVFIATSIAIFSNLTTGFMRSQVSTLVSNSEQGSAFAVLSGTESLINVFSPVTFLKIYPATLYISHGFTWLVTTAIFFIPFLLMTIVLAANKRRDARRGKEEGAPLLS